jgi:regulator of cell morphogenesis and NO signaling
MNTSDSIAPTTPLADLAASYPGAVRVLHRHGLDFCCHGRGTLGQACADKGLAIEEVVRDLEAAEEEARPSFQDWRGQALPILIDHLLTRFHTPHREELARLTELARKVETVHADKDACPRGLALHLVAMTQELEQHMQKEEQVLFPMVLSGRGAMAEMPMRVMEEEHRGAALLLQELRRLTGDFALPPEACASWTALYQGLEELERDLMEHIHLENNVLFPRVAAG